MIFLFISTTYKVLAKPTPEEKSIPLKKFQIQHIQNFELKEIKNLEQKRQDIKARLSLEEKRYQERLQRNTKAFRYLKQVKLKNDLTALEKSAQEKVEKKSKEILKKILKTYKNKLLDKEGHLRHTGWHREHILDTLGEITDSREKIQAEIRKIKDPQKHPYTLLTLQHTLKDLKKIYDQTVYYANKQTRLLKLKTKPNTHQLSNIKVSGCLRVRQDSFREDFTFDKDIVKCSGQAICKRKYPRKEHPHANYTSVKFCCLTHVKKCTLDGIKNLDVAACKPCGKADSQQKDKALGAAAEER